MPEIRLTTIINTKIDVVFDLSRSVDLHLLSTSQTGEKVIDGRSSGLMELSEHITWRAKHLGFVQNLTSKITEYQSPSFFVDEMVKGNFKSFRHEHHFSNMEDGLVKMTDVFIYVSPLGIIGKLIDFLYLNKYLTNFLKHRNQTIKDVAESEKWMDLLKIK